MAFLDIANNERRLGGKERVVSSINVGYPSFSLVVRCATCDLHVSCGAMHVIALCDGSYSVPRHLATVP